MSELDDKKRLLGEDVGVWEKVRLMLATIRVANLPSVVSNVLAGMALAVGAGDRSAWGGWSSVGLVVIGGLLYIAGNYLNDWKDCQWDREYRPERALPRGVFTAKAYGFAGMLCLCGALGVAAMYGMEVFLVAVWIAVGVGVYTRWHKEGAWTVWVMGACRGGLVALGVVEVMSKQGDWAWRPWLGCAALWVYIVALSRAARGESKASQAVFTDWVTLSMFGVVPVLAYGALALNRWEGLLGVGVYFVWLWMSRVVGGRGRGVSVGRLLAGIPWVDGLVLLPIGLAWGGGGGSGLVACMVPPVAFGMAVLLQRLAPAT